MTTKKPFMGCDQTFLKIGGGARKTQACSNAIIKSSQQKRKKGGTGLKERQSNERRRHVKKMRETFEGIGGTTWRGVVQ